MAKCHAPPSTRSASAPLALGLVLLAAAPAAAQPGGYAQVWADEFNGPAGFYDPAQPQWANWRARNDLQVRNSAYNDAAQTVAMTGTTCRITTFTGTSGSGQPRHYAGMISTQPSNGFGGFMPTYGYFEANIKFGNNPGQWSAFWLQSPTIGVPLGDPATAGTEMDVIEHRAIDGRNGNDIAGKGVANVHWDGYATGVGKSKGSPVYNLPGDPAGTGFHRYAMLWTPTENKYYVDDTLVWDASGGNSQAAVSQRSEYLILSSEVETGMWAGTIPTGGYGSYANSTAVMDVDYVRVYQPVPEPATWLLTGAAFGGVTAVRRRRR